MNVNRIISRPLVRRVAVAVAVALAVAFAVAVTGPDRSSGPGAHKSAGSVPATTQPATDGAVRAFFDRYVQPDGRVVRTDQGGDTVSEGQAYAMLVAAGAGDAGRFLAVWNWTRQHLQRSDGLLSWHWQAGAVVDPQSAADADVDAARALALAADRFSRPDFRSEAGRIARGVLGLEIVHSGDRTALAAGPWAVGSRTVNLSYFSPCADADLARVTGDVRWRNLADDAVTLTNEATDGGHRLPPDWARLDDAGGLQPIAAPGGGAGVRYGLDAARVAARLAERCDAPGDSDDRARHLAAELWPMLHHLPGDGGGIAYHLDGTPAAPADARNPVGLIGAAAAASAAGDGTASGRLLDEAETLDRQAPTYYGAAWLALTETMPMAKAGPDAPGDQTSQGTAGASRSVRLAIGGVRLIANTTGAAEPTTTTSAPSPSTTTSTAGATTTSTAPRATTTTTAAGGQPVPASTTTTSQPAGTNPPTVTPAAPEPAGAVPEPLQPGILTQPPGPPRSGSAPGTTAPAEPADNSTPARTGVLLAGLGVSGALGTRLGRRSL